MTVIASPLNLSVDMAPYLDVPATERIAARAELAITDRAWIPQVEDRQRDWIVSVAAPAFKILRARRGAEACKAFCALGTGSGVDALAGIELLGADVVGLTDLFDEVVATAAANVRRNLRPEHPVALYPGAGDLLQPLAGQGVRFDLIYENLPNLPLADAAQVEVERTSAAFLAPRAEPVPDAVKDWLLVLHYLALVQAKDFLKPGGAVISTIGARLPLSVVADMAKAAGFSASFLTYWWKVQADADDVIGSYAQWQRQGLGPFHFYPAPVLEAAFAGLDLEAAGRDAYAIERDLRGKRLDAVAAWDAHRRGERIGHTVAALHSELQS